MKALVIGSRGSRLALAQTNLVAGQIRFLYPELEVNVQVIKTTGDGMVNTPLMDMAGDTKGLFVKEIEEALLQCHVDLAVHSLKDVPTVLPDDLVLAAIPKRDDPFDALVADQPLSSLADLPEGARVGTSSLRRKVQMEQLRPDINIVPLRGNVDTRIRKLKEEQLAAIILASAGLRRMGLEERISYVFSVDQMVPAVGQGSLALEIRRGDQPVFELIRALDDPSTHRCVLAERVFLEAMGGGCQVPMGALAVSNGAQVSFSALVANPSGEKIIRHRFTGFLDELQPLALAAVAYFQSQGVEEILREVQSG